MTFLQIYIYANIYILFFWIFYKIFLIKSTFFQGQRIFIISSFTAAPLLPFLQTGMTSFFKSAQTIPTAFNPVNFIYKYSGVSKIGETISRAGYSIDWNEIILILILGGSIITAAYFFFNHFKIILLIRYSLSISKGQFRIVLPQIEIVPFIYNNKIFISGSTPEEERDLIIKHESQHYNFGHHFDNYLIQFFQTIFWLNPAFYLLKRELKLIHEYQVDNHIISSGIDATIYKLALVKIRAGKQKFAIANGLNNCRIKNRIIMMNTIKTQKGKWRFILLIPALCIVFFSLSFTNVTPPIISDQPQDSEMLQDTDSVEIKIVTLPEDYKISHDEALLVLINKVSDVAIQARFAPEGERVGTIIKKYEELREDRFFKQLTPLVKIIVQKDQNTNEQDYKALLDEISTAIYSMHETSAQNRFERSFKDLKKEEQAKILEMYPPVIYYAPAKQIKPPPRK